MAESYETQATGLRIVPGQWRPHYLWEHIAWVSPPWPSQDYVWLDFPEAIFTSQGLIFLSHINPSVPSVYTDLPAVAWESVPDGIAFERQLPNGVRFGGSVTRQEERTVRLHLFIENTSTAPLENITLQTCVFLRACREFADYTMDNKFVHVPQEGWLPFREAQSQGDSCCAYALGWRGGPRVADLPYMVARSNQGQRHVAMTWGKNTLSLVGNPGHPCFHADPFFPDLDVGQQADINGELVFFEGDIRAIESRLQE